MLVDREKEQGSYKERWEIVIKQVNYKKEVVIMKEMK
jgi:hypothetical protein